MQPQKDFDIYQYFDDINEPEPDEMFVESVIRRTEHLKRNRLIKHVLASLIFLLVLVFLTPWIVGITLFIARSSTCLVHSIAALPEGLVAIAVTMFSFLFLFKYLAVDNM